MNTAISTESRLSMIPSSRQWHASVTVTASGINTSNTAPIHRLPPELLGIIFWFSVPRTSEFVKPSINTAPLLLCRVCRYWRDLAERTPELWSSISFNAFRPYDLAEQAFERWIAHSGNVPLLVKVVVLSKSAYTDGRPVGFGQPHPLLSFIHSLARQSYRWLVADIAVPGKFMSSLLDVEAPILRRLILSDPLAEAGSDITDVWEHNFNLSHAPAVRQLIVRQRLYIRPSIMHPITSIKFDAFSATQIADLFDGCSLLEELGITFTSEVTDFCRTIWTFPRLHTLRIHFFCSQLSPNQSNSSSVFLEHLCSPVLRILSIDGLQKSPNTYLSSLLDSTHGDLESLTLQNITISHTDISEYLLRIPRLKVLHFIESKGFDRRCMRRISWLSGLRANVCPHLRELWLLRSDCHILGLETVENFVASRSPSSADKLRHRHDAHHRDPDTLLEFRFDGTKQQHDDLSRQMSVITAIKNGLKLKR